MLPAVALRRWGVPLLGVASLIAGLVLALAPTPLVSGAAGRYTSVLPTSGPAGAGSPSLQELLGYDLVIVGIVLVAGWAIMARRRRPAPPAGAHPDIPASDASSVATPGAS
jgi:hypothetical protein